MERIRAIMIKQAMDALGLRFQNQLANYLSIKENFITKWKTGRVKNPREIEDMVKLGNELLKHCNYFQIEKCMDPSLLQRDLVMICLQRSFLEVINEAKWTYAEELNDNSKIAVIEYKVKQRLKEKFDYELE